LDRKQLLKFSYYLDPDSGIYVHLFIIMKLFCITVGNPSTAIEHMRKATAERNNVG